jgi:proteasome lid subunit RPN8/RPN11
MQMAEDVSRRAPEEACGLVSGKNGRSLSVYPIENILHSQSRFRMHPEQQVKAYFELLEKGLDLLAIYHSHPKGPPDPSPTDIAEAAYPEAVNLIWFSQQGVWNCRGYSIREGQVSEFVICQVDIG